MAIINDMREIDKLPEGIVKLSLIEGNCGHEKLYTIPPFWSLQDFYDYLYREEDLVLYEVKKEQIIFCDVKGQKWQLRASS